MKSVKMRSLLVAAAALLVSAPARPASADLKGFPFTDEALKYTVNWPSGLSLGEVQLRAQHSGSNWRLTMTLDAGVPGFAVKDTYTSNATAELCSSTFERDTRHGSRKSQEKETIDQ